MATARSLAVLTRREAVQAALDQFAQLGQDAFLQRYGFAAARGYVVRDPKTGLWADSKAIAAAAFGFEHPEAGPLRASEFSGGAATVQRRLKALGFEVEQLDGAAGEYWQLHEVALIVADYLAMLQLELAGQPYNKAAHRRALVEQLPGRSAGSIEFKHQNISAVLLELGYPYIKGYLPRSNFQRMLLVDEVERQVVGHQQLDVLSLDAASRPAAAAQHVDFTAVLAAAPELKPATGLEQGRLASLGRAVKRDYLAREAENRSLGLAGELFALDFERWRLTGLGAGQLAEQVRHVAVEDGDGLGYDIRSFDTDGTERFIEVKTTGFGERTPFFVSANEARFARERQARFHLYRLFDFRAAPRMFELVGPIEHHCRLDAATFRASFG